MKKLLLTFTAAVLCASVADAQKLAIYEEFSGENCAPCAAANPGLWTLLSSNPTKVILLKYQSPIPSAGPIYNAYKTITDARMNYYSVPFAPYGRLNGTILGSGTAAPTSPGHVANLLQSDINSATTGAAPFTMTISHAWNATGDSVTANVAITATSAFAPTGANLKLRIAVIEHLVYATPPGTNGEKDFHNVVREMVPNAGGTQLPNSWTASQSQNFTIKGKLPNILDKSNKEVILVAWIQDDADKAIHQAAKSSYVPITLDAGTVAITPASPIGCATTTTTVGATVTLKNTGTTPLTSAKIYYRADNGAYGATPVSWTGTLAPNATTTVTIPPVTLSQGARSIVDSVAMPNNSTDINHGNNVSTAKVTVLDPTPKTLPLSSNFEVGSSGGFPAGWLAFETANTGNNWVNGNGTGLAHNGSNYMPWFKIGTYPSGTVGYLLTPVPKVTGAAAMDFWQAYAQKTASNNDKLEVVYSTNCGSSWNVLWSAAGSSLATTNPTATYWLPSPASGTPDWKLRTVDLSSLPNNAILAFRATANGGNNLFLDDINIRTGGVGVKNIIAENSVNVYPNPAREAATLEFTLGSASKVTVTVLDATGRTVSVVTDAQLQQGAQRVSIPTANLASGVYNIAIRTEAGILTQRLSVVK